MDGFGGLEEDPAAEFIAREQNNLAGLEDDLNPVKYNQPIEDGFNNQQGVSPPGSFEMVDGDNVSAQNNHSEYESVKETVQTDVLQSEDGEFNSEPMTNSVPKVAREEPEKIKKWREEQKKRLEEKDANEEMKKEEWRAAAKKELEEWYKHHEDLITKTKAVNRNAEKQFVAEINAIEPGTEWERIAKLCDFNPKSSKSSKDVSRMRSIILQLKQNPLVKA
ncbi:UNVERIFIED_CONTAM: hypothetical protein PYX00_007113 [Menopon gallinae]|uniref:Clathrin light chain n=1 Tax=Menopon gallinae TaxID=328185 RepID=A0AAW2HHK1_9NEOP